MVVVFVTKVKTSIYIDSDLWASFKNYVSKNGSEINRKLEELIEDALVERELYNAFPQMGLPLR